MPELYIEYRNGKPHAYRYGEEWEAMRLAMEGGFKTEQEAREAYEREQHGALRAKWEDKQIGKWVYAHCPLCNTTHDAKSNYCPFCGARMEG